MRSGARQGRDLLLGGRPRSGRGLLLNQVVVADSDCKRPGTVDDGWSSVMAMALAKDLALPSAKGLALASTKGLALASTKGLALASTKGLALASAKDLALPLMVVVMPIPATIIRHRRLTASGQRLALQETGQEARIAAQLGDGVLVRGLMIGCGHAVLHAECGGKRLPDEGQRPSKADRSTFDAGREGHSA
jgi:hypothetical protein